MPTGILGVVGPTTPASGVADGVSVAPRMGRMGELIVSEFHARSYEATARGGRFGAAMQAVLATATIAGLNASITGVSLISNPLNSGIYVSVERVGLGIVLAPAAPLAFGIATGYSATPIAGTLTALVPKSKLIGSVATPKALAYASAALTLPVAGTVDTVLGQIDTGAVTTVTSVPAVYELGGSIVLAPGGFAYLWTSAVLLASAHIMSWDWEEVAP